MLGVGLGGEGETDITVCVLGMGLGGKGEIDITLCVCGEWGICEVDGVKIRSDQTTQINP